MAIENGVQNAELGYILDPAFQIEGLNGKPVIGGWICIYEAGTDNKYISFENFDGARNPFKVPLKSDGRAVILGDPSLLYDIYAYDSYGNQLFSRLNVQCNVPGTINLSGADTRIKNTDGTLDISLQTISNNVREYTVNTRNKTLDVQEPLYFVENSESATIIGCRSQSGEYATTAYVESAISGKLDISSYSSQSGNFLTDKFEYDNSNHITAYNNSAFAGTEYEAGDNIDITNNRISVTGLPTSSDVQNAISSAVTNVENKFEYNTNNYITAYNNSAFAGKEYSAGDYVSIENDTISVTGLQPSGDYVTHDEMTGYQPAGDYYSASNPSGFITNDAITGLQPSGDYATHDDLTAYATTALVSSVSSELYSAISSISGDFELVAGSGVELVDDPNAKTTTINVTAEGTPVTAIEMMIESATSGLQPSGDYATTAQVADKLDTTAFSTVSGDFLTAHQDLSNYATTASVAAKLDTTAFSDVSGSFLTAVPESALSGFAEYSAISAKLAPEDVVVFIYGKQSAAYPYILSAYSAGKLCFAKYEYQNDYYPLLTCQSANPNFGYGYNLATFGKLRAGVSNQDHSVWQDTVTTADLSLLFVDGASDKSGNPGWNYGWTSNFFTPQKAGNYYSASNPSGFITAVPDTYLQNTDLSTEDGKVTAISGIPLSAGSDVPEGVMSESGLEYNAVNEISGYNGSAIAQYGAEKQWLVHDDTLVHAANSAQYALGVNLSAVAQLLGVDETVLWEGTDPLDQSCLVNVTRTTASLSEPLTAFNKIRIYAVWNPWISNFTGCNTFEYPGTNYKGAYIMNATDNSNYLAGGSWSATDTTFTLIKHWQAVYGQAKQTDTGLGGIFKIVGIGRKQ